jgi:hypothetical protein
VAAALASKTSAEVGSIELYTEAGAAIVDVLFEARDSLLARLVLVEIALARIQWLAEEIDRRKSASAEER